jgi:DNA-binding CsgD family transcriptional regulator
MKDIVWDKIMLRELESLASLTDEERIVLHDWGHGKSIVYTSMQHHMSERKINNLRNSIRAKYDAVQIYTPLLPKRNVK